MLRMNKSLSTKIRGTNLDNTTIIHITKQFHFIELSAEEPVFCNLCIFILLIQKRLGSSFSVGKSRRRVL